jgi:hypothetical protein
LDCGCLQPLWLVDACSRAWASRFSSAFSPLVTRTQDLSRNLRAYGEQYKDPVIDFKPVTADLDWAIAGEGKYEMAERMGKKKPGRIQRKKKAE